MFEQITKFANETTDNVGRTVNDASNVINDVGSSHRPVNRGRIA